MLSELSIKANWSTDYEVKVTFLRDDRCLARQLISNASAWPQSLESEANSISRKQRDCIAPGAQSLLNTNLRLPLGPSCSCICLPKLRSSCSPSEMPWTYLSSSFVCAWEQGVQHPS